MTQPIFHRGDTVRLNCPTNTTLHGAEAVISELTPWGAHVWTIASATGRFRALFSEMLPAGPELLPECAKGVEVTHLGPIDAATVKVGRNGVNLGYSGDMCDVCGSAKMIRNGSCLLCQDCGSTTGCS